MTAGDVLNDKGLLLDLDGTLADSLTALKGVYFSFLSQFGVTGSETEFDRLNGPPLASIVETLKQAHDLPGEMQDLIDRYSQMVEKAHRSAKLASGAAELLSYARDCGWKLAVVTSSPQSSATKWLHFAGIADRFSVVISGDDVRVGKPSPNPYLLALSRLGCSAAVSRAVEDSRLGATSAIAAGLTTWALASPDDHSGWPSGVIFVQRLSDIMKSLQTC
jgi:HAD superfamily hydrolase (TIGR01509 family)